MSCPASSWTTRAEDRAAIQPVIDQINMYPAREFDGTMKSIDWNSIPESAARAATEETQWVFPATFFDELPRCSPMRRRCPARRLATRRSSRC